MCHNSFLLKYISAKPHLTLHIGQHPILCLTSSVMLCAANDRPDTSAKQTSKQRDNQRRDRTVPLQHLGGGGIQPVYLFAHYDLPLLQRPTPGARHAEPTQQTHATAQVNMNMRSFWLSRPLCSRCRSSTPSTCGHCRAAAFKSNGYAWWCQAACGSIKLHRCRSAPRSCHPQVAAGSLCEQASESRGLTPACPAPPSSPASPVRRKKKRSMCLPAV